MKIWEAILQLIEITAGSDFNALDAEPTFIDTAILFNNDNNGKED